MLLVEALYVSQKVFQKSVIIKNHIDNRGLDEIGLCGRTRIKIIVLFCRQLGCSFVNKIAHSACFAGCGGKDRFHKILKCY